MLACAAVCAIPCTRQFSVTDEVCSLLSNMSFPLDSEHYSASCLVLCVLAVSSAVPLFFCMVKLIDDVTKFYPPSRQFFASCVDVLGQVCLLCPVRYPQVSVHKGWGGVCLIVDLSVCLSVCVRMSVSLCVRTYVVPS